MPLDPEVSALLERQKDLPPRSSLSVAQTRKMMRRAGALAGEPPALPRVEKHKREDGVAELRVALRLQPNYPEAQQLLHQIDR